MTPTEPTLPKPPTQKPYTAEDAEGDLLQAAINHVRAMPRPSTPEVPASSGKKPHLRLV